MLFLAQVDNINHLTSELVESRIRKQRNMICSSKEGENKMILVSINTQEKFCAIDIIHRLMTVHLVREFFINKNSTWRTICIFRQLLKGVFILCNRLMFSKLRLINL